MIISTTMNKIPETKVKPANPIIIHQSNIYYLRIEESVSRPMSRYISTRIIRPFYGMGYNV